MPPAPGAQNACSDPRARHYAAAGMADKRGAVWTARTRDAKQVLNELRWGSRHTDNPDIPHTPPQHPNTQPFSLLPCVTRTAARVGSLVRQPCAVARLRRWRQGSAADPPAPVATQSDSGRHKTFVHKKRSEYFAELCCRDSRRRRLGLGDARGVIAIRHRAERNARPNPNAGEHRSLTCKSYTHRPLRSLN